MKRYKAEQIEMSLRQIGVRDAKWVAWHTAPHSAHRNKVRAIIGHGGTTNRAAADIAGEPRLQLRLRERDDHNGNSGPTEVITSLKLKEKANQETWGFFLAGKITYDYRMPKGYGGLARSS